MVSNRKVVQIFLGHTDIGLAESKSRYWKIRGTRSVNTPLRRFKPHHEDEE